VGQKRQTKRRVLAELARGRVKRVGRKLAEWLNSADAIHHPVAKAIMDMQDMARYAQLSRADPWRGYEDVGEEDGQEREIAELERRRSGLRRITRKYPMFYDVAGMDPEADNVFMQVHSLGRSQEQIDGCQALSHWKTLAEAETQSLLRRCDLPDCMRWYYARQSDQRFDTYRCRDKNRRSRPEYKRKHREREKKRYHDEHYGVSSMIRRTR
jgi:hypothetical protein